MVEKKTEQNTRCWETQKKWGGGCNEESYTARYTCV